MNGETMLAQRRGSMGEPAQDPGEVGSMTRLTRGRHNGRPVYDLLIVGGGPAALAAAYYARTRQLNAVMVYQELGGRLGWRHRFADPDEARSRFDQDRRPLGERVGDGLARDLDDEHIPGNEVVRMLISRAVMQAGQVIHDRALQVALQDAHFEVPTHKHGVLHSRAVLVATGASPLPLNVPGAHYLADQRLLYAIPTYAHLVAGKQVAVIGTTQRVLRSVMELARTAARVYLITPDSSACTPALMTALQRQPNIEVLLGSTVQDVLGGNAPGKALEGLIHVDHGQSRRLDVQHAFVDLGLVPNSELVQGLVRMDSAGFIIVDAHNETTVPGLFAVGDVTTTCGEHVLVAVGDGVRAAMHAYDYLLARRIAPVPEAVV